MIDRIKKYLKLMGIGALLCLIFLIGAKSTLDSYHSFYGKEDYDDSLIKKALSNILYFKPIQIFTSYTGFDTGYGFFAPNVCSDFVIIYDLKDSLGNVLESRIMPPLECKESMIRFNTSMGIYLDKVTEGEKLDSTYNNYLNIVLRQVSEYIKIQNAEATSVETQLYLYDYSSIEESKKVGVQENIIPVESFIY